MQSLIYKLQIYKIHWYTNIQITDVQIQVKRLTYITEDKITITSTEQNRGYECQVLQLDRKSSHAYLKFWGNLAQQQRVERISEY